MHWASLRGGVDHRHGEHHRSKTCFFDDDTLPSDFGLRDVARETFGVARTAVIHVFRPQAEFPGHYRVTYRGYEGPATTWGRESVTEAAATFHSEEGEWIFISHVPATINVAGTQAKLELVRSGFTGTDGDVLRQRYLPGWTTVNPADIPGLWKTMWSSEPRPLADMSYPSQGYILMRSGDSLVWFSNGNNIGRGDVVRLHRVSETRQ